MMNAPTVQPPRLAGALGSKALLLLDLVLLVTLLILAAAWLWNPFYLSLGPLRLTIHWGLKPLLAPAVILLARGLLKKGIARRGTLGRGLWETAVFKKIILALCSTYLLIALLELGLAGARFEAELPPIIFQGQNAEGGVEIPRTAPDPALMFRLIPGSYFQGRLINSLGFREREVDPHKQPGTVRVLCMGDSVTGQGRPGYSHYLHQGLLQAPPTPQPWEAFNIGVHGYSALQGLRQFQMLGRQLSPDVVTLYFGWNDHWLSEEADRQKMGLEMRPWAGRIFEVLRQKRFFKFFIWAASPVQHLARRSQGQERVLRVPPDEYRSVLKAFIKEIRATGAIPLLITAPRRSLTSAVVGKRYVVSIEEGNRTHDQYIDITRKVAQETGAELLDLAAILAGPECDAYFAPDGIHFDFFMQEGSLAADPPSQPGLMRIAAEIDQRLREMVSSPAWPKKHAADE